VNPERKRCKASLRSLIDSDNITSMTKACAGAIAVALLRVNALAQTSGAKLDHVMIAVRDLEAVKLKVSRRPAPRLNSRRATAILGARHRCQKWRLAGL
jgi:hypothetical protein